MFQAAPLLLLIYSVSGTPLVVAIVVENEHKVYS